jgi:hypothetical protein
VPSRDFGEAISALGQKQTWHPSNAMSVIHPKADIDVRCWDVRFVPKADIGSARLISALRPKADIRQRDLDPSSSLDAAHNIIL